MDAAQSKAAFRQVQALFQAERYVQCVEILLRLNKAHPDNRNILFPLAQSLAKCGKAPEAVRVCDRLIEKFGHDGAQALRNELQPPAEMTMDLDLNSLDAGLDLDGAMNLDIGLDLDSGSSSSAFGAGPALPQASAASEWTPYAIWGGLLVSSFVLRLVVMQTLGAETYAWLGNIDETTVDFDSMPPFPFASFFYFALTNAVYIYLLACFVGYISLMSLHELKHEEFSEDMKDVALYTLFCLPLCLLPIFGWLAVVVILMRHYDLPFGRTAVLIFVWIVFDIVVSIPLQMLTGQFVPTS